MWRFPTCRYSAKAPRKGQSHPLQTGQHFLEPRDPPLHTWFSWRGSAIMMCPRVSTEEGHRCCATLVTVFPSQWGFLSYHRKRDLQFSFCRKTHLFLSSTKLIPCLAACSWALPHFTTLDYPFYYTDSFTSLNSVFLNSLHSMLQSRQGRSEQRRKEGMREGGSAPWKCCISLEIKLLFSQ